MSEQKKYQSNWDSVLITGFVNRKTMAWCIWKFLKKQLPDVALNELRGDFNACYEVATKYNLKRFFTHVDKGGVKYMNSSRSVLYTVGQCSQSLAGALLNDNNNPIDILFSIKKFKWVLNSKSRAERTNEERKQKRFIKSTIIEKQRSKSADWNNVK